MNTDEGEAHREWNGKVRNETPTQQLDRNWNALLQELRVVQTGVQLLTGFLLTVPFQGRFDQLSSTGRVVYLVTVTASIVATILLIAPVGMHRLLFRKRAVGILVRVGNRLAILGLVALAIALVGVVALTFEIVLGIVAAEIAAVVVALLLIGLWWVLPRAYLAGDDEVREAPVS
ncbi:DUF6328 family protein [Rhodococcoides kyotonense]|uniref:Sodium:proton antiporter n=1 Tax=Rhodococcoides kyotonense TaxID=398843 RepID=A0A239CJC4_9NOCA|nr:DUF6328 family protein [Rhodococcus kyotonensis]SNS19463.1 hypothetical protein SAMN05421642_10115 [Rhodococcus kyotonensis]